MVKSTSHAHKHVSQTKPGMAVACGAGGSGKHVKINSLTRHFLEQVKEARQGYTDPQTFFEYKIFIRLCAL